MIYQGHFEQKGYISMYQEGKRVAQFIRMLEKETEDFSFNTYQIMDLLNIIYLIRISDALDRISLDL